MRCLLSILFPEPLEGQVLVISVFEIEGGPIRRGDGGARSWNRRIQLLFEECFIQCQSGIDRQAACPEAPEAFADGAVNDFARSGNLTL